jgi:hypothetical protein
MPKHVINPPAAKQDLVNRLQDEFDVLYPIGVRSHVEAEYRDSWANPSGPSLDEQIAFLTQQIELARENIRLAPERERQRAERDAEVRRIQEEYAQRERERREEQNRNFDATAFIRGQREAEAIRQATREREERAARQRDAYNRLHFPENYGPDGNPLPPPPLQRQDGQHGFSYIPWMDESTRNNATQNRQRGGKKRRGSKKRRSSRKQRKSRKPFFGFF